MRGSVAWLVVAGVAMTAGVGLAAEWFVTPTGSKTGKGTAQAPWDIESALGGQQPVAPGDTLWIRRGTYRRAPRNVGQGYPVRLAGQPNAPITVRAWPGERVTVDGGLDVQPPSTYLCIRDLEIVVSDPRPPAPIPPDPTYASVNRPWGGLNVHTGTGCRYINLVIHDNCQGVSFWRAATDSELYGCLIYDNGWAGTDRGHGHAIYTQNDAGVKTIADCIMTGGYGYTMHAYGSARADVNNYLVVGNICYDAGPFLIGGGKPSKGIRVLGNVLYGVRMQIGYDAPYNEDCDVRGNLIVNGALTIRNYRRATNEANLVLGPGDPRPSGVRVVLRPNRYDPKRAHLALLNWDRAPFVDVGLGDFLRPGDGFRFMNPRDFFGKPVLSGRYTGKAVRVPMKGEFAALVVLRSAREGAPRGAGAREEGRRRGMNGAQGR